MNRNVAGRVLATLLIALTSLGAMSLKRAGQSAADDEIRIGNLMPYTGPLSEFAAIGKAEAAYFEMINERGGINGRKVRFISHDDNSDPTVALDLTRGLVEREDVLLMFGSYGTPGNLAVRSFLNERGIPQLFVASGAEELSDPKALSLDDGLATVVSRRGAHLRQLHPCILFATQDRGALAERPVRSRFVQGNSGGPRRIEPHDHRRCRL